MNSGASTGQLPVLLVTPKVPLDRVGAFAQLASRVPLEIATFGGREHHFVAGDDSADSQDLAALTGATIHELGQREIASLASSRRWASVIAGTAGRLAFPGAWWGARKSASPFVIWAAMWHEPTTLPFLLARPLLRKIIRDADASAAYGSHVTAHLRGLGARNICLAPQAVDAEFWSAPRTAPRSNPEVLEVVFIGRDEPGKGLRRLLEAWRLSGLGESGAGHLSVIGPAQPAGVTANQAAGVHFTGPLDPVAVRDHLDQADVVCVPSEPTAGFVEPWSLVCNEAFMRGVAAVTSDTVGAAAGGLVRDGRNGLVYRSSDSAELASKLSKLNSDRELLGRLKAAAKLDIAPFTHSAWAAGMLDAIKLAQLCRSRSVGTLNMQF